MVLIDEVEGTTTTSNHFEYASITRRNIYLEMVQYGQCEYEPKVFLAISKDALELLLEIFGYTEIVGSF